MTIQLPFLLDPSTGLRMVQVHPSIVEFALRYLHQCLYSRAAGRVSQQTSGYRPPTAF